MIYWTDMTIHQFINNVSDKIIDYLRDNKTQDMQEVRNIIALHFSQGLIDVFYDEEAEIAKMVESLQREQKYGCTSPKRNSEINAELLRLSQRRKAIRKRASEAMDENEAKYVRKLLKEKSPEIYDEIYKSIPMKKSFIKLK